MSCGAPVIGSNLTSVPEVIGRQDALFDPCDVLDISQKLKKVLEDEVFRAELVVHGLKQAQKFSWDTTARRVITAYEHLHSRSKAPQALLYRSIRPKLVYVSPLPPERTGIADYSAELLPALAKYYDIEVVVAQEQVSDTWVQSNCPIRDSQWLRSNAHKIDRVLYHVGNSPFHQHMFSLIEEIPGTVVLHDFFLSGLLSYLENFDILKYAWVHALYQSHGYLAVQERYHERESGDVQTKYPVNLQIMQNAQGVIVHSDYSRNLANEWYGNNFSEDWKVIPLLRKPCKKIGRAQSRKILGLKVDDYVICSFGFLDSTKLNHCLLQAWLESGLSKDLNCVLIFVGENHGGEYGLRLLENIRASGLVKRIFISGWVDSVTYSHYLAATDLAVQLRTLSRGETSAAVLDCMNHALPTIVNANGSMANLPSDAVWRIPDNFAQSQLVEALEILWKNAEKRITLGKRAQKNIQTQHAPDQCAKQYVEAIEQFHNQSQYDTHSLVKAIAELDGHSATDSEYRLLSQAIAQSFPEKQPIRQLFLDISATFRTNLKTGIERVVRALVMDLIKSPPAGYRVEPIYLTNEGGNWHYRYARRYTLGLLGCPSETLVDEVVEPRNGDILLGMDLSGHQLLEAEASGLFNDYRNVGVAVYFVVYDLLPVLMPQFFPPGADVTHSKWLQTIGKFDGAICISATVAEELSAWLKIEKFEQRLPFRISWFHLGADLENSNPTSGLPKKAPETLAQLGNRPSFLMVGTIEPRKGYLQTLDAFTKLWAQGVDINLVIVGNEGWKSLPDDRRRTIPEIIKRLRNHPECNKRLFWLEGISDEYLEKVYATSACLIAASEGEGFGLPIIEAAVHHMPIIARDIAVFREVANENAHYFSGDSASHLVEAIKEWLMLFKKNKTSSKQRINWNSWSQSSAMLIDAILEKSKRNE
jgi:glycosyltransferase involved in cell wall biosynthesis